MCRFVCCLWFTQPITALVTADQATDTRKDRTLSAVFVHPNLRVLGSQLNLEFVKGECWHQTLSLLAWTGCWKELLANAWMECHLVHNHFQIWILSMMSLYLPNCLNSSYLHLRRWHQRPHLSGSSWTGKSPAFGQQGTRAIDNHNRAGGCSSWRICLSRLPFHFHFHLTIQSSPDISSHNAITRTRSVFQSTLTSCII